MSELLEKILDKRNMNEAYQKVCANKGAGGVDGMELSELDGYIPDTVPVLTDISVRTGTVSGIYPSSSLSSMPSTPPAPLLAQTFWYASFMFLLSSIFSNSSDILCVLRSFPLPVINPMLCVYSSYTFRLHPLVRYSQVHTFVCTVTLFSPSDFSYYGFC